ncbi:hypothetical protein C0991_003733 [Blastosporella zonata]|nr:hypothetical protein C0991_003733 [Blastosporella zonata]
MTGTGNTLFWGDNAHNENAQDFFKSFNYAMGSKDDDYKRRQFLYCLHSGGAAKTWYMGLTDHTKADWSLVEEAFNARWPPIKIAAMTTEEFEEELLSCRLAEEVLGLKECIADRDIWSHIAWADRIGTLAAGADILGSKTYIGQVKKSLPGVMRDKLSDSYANWTAFLDDVCGIDIDYIKGKAADAKKLLASNGPAHFHFIRDSKPPSCKYYEQGFCGGQQFTQWRLTSHFPELKCKCKCKRSRAYSFNG